MALRAVGTTYPNPPVGAIIVKNSSIISRGWTQPRGVPHAEIHAINKIGKYNLKIHQRQMSIIKKYQHYLSLIAVITLIAILSLLMFSN